MMMSDIHERFYGLTVKKTIGQFNQAITKRIEEMALVDEKRVATIGEMLKKAGVDMSLDRLLELVEGQIEIRLGGVRMSPELVALLREADAVRIERGYAKGLKRLLPHLAPDDDQERVVLVPTIDLTIFEPYDPKAMMRNTPQRFYGDEATGAPLGIGTATHALAGMVYPGLRPAQTIGIEHLALLEEHLGE
jgi:hypothetical protein